VGLFWYVVSLLGRYRGLRSVGWFVGLGCEGISRGGRGSKSWCVCMGGGRVGGISERLGIPLQGARVCVSVRSVRVRCVDI